MVVLSSEQQSVLDNVGAGRDVIVDSTVGSGKTSTIQELCNVFGSNNKILYLTYSRLLKLDAQRRVRNAETVQNYHGLATEFVNASGRAPVGISEVVAVFNRDFKQISHDVIRYDIIVVDEYQDINEQYAQMLRNIKSLNPVMQVVLVGDLEQRVRSDTAIDIEAFRREICDDPVEVAFTQSFRIGPDLAAGLSTAWEKPVVGANAQNEVVFMTKKQVVREIGTLDPKDFICLGKRNGEMVGVLNDIEKAWPKVFNKNTVFMSVRDGDAEIDYGDNVAVFTTFDASKGMERETAFVFDYDFEYWRARSAYPDTDLTILRNIFLVAASRGKRRVVFVTPGGEKPYISDKLGQIGGMGITRFMRVNESELPVYKQVFNASDAFKFKYAENIETCFDLLDVTRLDDGTGEVISIDRQDGLIDLSAAVGAYQEALFFKGYSAKRALSDVLVGSDSGFEPEDLSETDSWHNALVIAGATFEQNRYIKQVTRRIEKDVEQQLYDRLAAHLSPDCKTQLHHKMKGIASRRKDVTTTIAFSGFSDAYHDGRIFELKFVSELDHLMFLQLAMYLVMSGVEEGVLWNTRTDERWLVKVPDPALFMNAVVRCVTKQSYIAFTRD